MIHLSVLLVAIYIGPIGLVIYMDRYARFKDPRSAMTAVVMGYPTFYAPSLVVPAAEKWGWIPIPDWFTFAVFLPQAILICYSNLQK